VKPILAARCYACHGALKQKGGLRLDTVALMKKGGDTGPAIIVGKSEEIQYLLHNHIHKYTILLSNHTLELYLLKLRSAPLQK